MKKITFKELEELINSGECKLLYLSTSSLWFTHDPADVKRATRLGKKSQKKLLKKHLADKGVPEKDKILIRSLAKKSKASPVPLDPSGAPLFINSNPKDWIKNIKRNPMHFGKFTLEAFILTHAKNCGGIAYSTWGEAQTYLENIN